MLQHHRWKVSSQSWLRIKNQIFVHPLPHISRDWNSISVTSVHTVQTLRKRKQIVVCCCRLSLIAFYHIFSVRPCMVGDRVCCTLTHLFIFTQLLCPVWPAKVVTLGHELLFMRYMWATVSNTSLKKVLCFPANCGNLRVKLIGVLIGALCAPLRYTAKMRKISEKWKLQKKSQAKKLYKTEGKWALDWIKTKPPRWIWIWTPSSWWGSSPHGSSPRG